MKIIHVIANLAARYGGPSQACVEMARAVAARGHDVAIYTTDMDGPERLPVPYDRPVMDRGVAIHYFPAHAPRFWGASWRLARALGPAIRAADVVHIHSLYMFHDWVAGHYCQAFATPYLLRPHGTLDPFLHTRHRARKMVMERLFQNRVIARAGAVHFTTEEEMRLAAPYVHGAPGVVIPNGIDPATYAPLPPRGTFRARYPELGDKRIVLFFGRLNFKKGLDLLIDAFARLAARHDDLHLVLAGPDGGMGAKVQAWLRERDLAERATFTGMVRGADKLAVLADADVFALPSYSENFGIAVVEAMACGLPVVISDKVNIWREVAQAGAGLVTPVDAARIAEAIETVLSDPAAARAMGRAGKALARRRFDWKEIGVTLEDAYGALKARDRPATTPATLSGSIETRP